MWDMGTRKYYPGTEDAGDNTGHASPCNYDDDDYKALPRNYLGIAKYYL